MVMIGHGDTLTTSAYFNKSVLTIPLMRRLDLASLGNKKITPAE
jgi:hypothetical protein